MHFPGKNPVITLTTDFGLTDHYVGTVKGVILGRCPSAHIVDISHNITPFSVWSGAYTIDQSAPYFPPQTIHVVIVDPGVGTARKPILIQTERQFFIAPDNGVLSMIFRHNPGATVREIAATELFLPEPSFTFHGRDVFAPVAASFAQGLVAVEQIGPVMPSIQILDCLEPVAAHESEWTGRVLSVDHFGNVITNFRTADFPLHPAREFTIQAAGKAVTSFHRTFGDAPRDLCFAYAGSSGFLELGITERSAARFLNVSAGDTLRLLLA